MPEISRFFGIVIRMHFDEHLPPHFHAYYGEFEAAVEITSLEMLAGQLPSRALALTVEWAAQHRDELRAVGIGAAAIAQDRAAWLASCRCSG